MGIYSNQYIPRITHRPGLAQSKVELVTADKTGEIKYTNNDEFVFVNHDNTETTLSSLSNSDGSNVLNIEVEITSAELLSGVTKTILPVPDTGYTYNILGFYLVYNYNSSTYTDSGTVQIRGLVNSSYTQLYGLATDYCFLLDRSNISRFDSSSTIVVDLYSSYDLVIPAMSSGDGTAKLIVQYVLQPIN